jgi:hypothetical protein
VAGPQRLPPGPLLRCWHLALSAYLKEVSSTTLTSWYVLHVYWSYIRTCIRRLAREINISARWDREFRRSYLKSWIVAVDVKLSLLKLASSSPAGQTSRELALTPWQHDCSMSRQKRMEQVVSPWSSSPVGCARRQRRQWRCDCGVVGDLASSVYSTTEVAADGRYANSMVFPRLTSSSCNWTLVVRLNFRPRWAN